MTTRTFHTAKEDSAVTIHLSERLFGNSTRFASGPANPRRLDCRLGSPSGTHGVERVSRRSLSTPKISLPRRLSGQPTRGRRLDHALSPISLPSSEKPETQILKMASSVGEKRSIHTHASKYRIPAASAAPRLTMLPIGTPPESPLTHGHIARGGVCQNIPCPLPILLPREIGSALRIG